MKWQPGQTLADLEKETIMAALGFYHGNKSATASALGINVKTLYNKLNEYGVKIEHREPGSFKREEREEDKSETKVL